MISLFRLLSQKLPTFVLIPTCLLLVFSGVVLAQVDETELEFSVVRGANIENFDFPNPDFSFAGVWIEHHEQEVGRKDENDSDKKMLNELLPEQPETDQMYVVRYLDDKLSIGDLYWRDDFFAVSNYRVSGAIVGETKLFLSEVGEDKYVFVKWEFADGIVRIYLPDPNKLRMLAANRGLESVLIKERTCEIDWEELSQLLIDEEIVNDCFIAKPELSLRRLDLPKAMNKGSGNE